MAARRIARTAEVSGDNHSGQANHAAVTISCQSASLGAERLVQDVRGSMTFSLPGKSRGQVASRAVSEYLSYFASTRIARSNPSSVVGYMRAFISSLSTWIDCR